ncbi:hypothetical protein MHYP_G00327030, partial [Metynnis hypsauchen]
MGLGFQICSLASLSQMRATLSGSLFTKRDGWAFIFLNCPNIIFTGKRDKIIFNLHILLCLCECYRYSSCFLKKYGTNIKKVNKKAILF